MRVARIHLLPMAAPDDVAGLLAAIEAGDIQPKGVIAVIGKTEGNGCVNDFTRAFAARAVADALAPYRKDGPPVLVMSGGTEGALSPHVLVIEQREELAAAGPALAVGAVQTGALGWQNLGRVAQVHQVAAGVRQAMADAGISKAEDVHFVQVKCPLLTAARMAACADPVTQDALKSMSLSRAASALGVALALGEVMADQISDAAIGIDTGLWSGRASSSAGVELDGHEIVVLGMATGWGGPLAIDHAVMADQIDIEPVRACLDRLGLGAPGQLTPAQQGGMIALLAKAEAGRSGQLRGRRHTMLDDSDISATRHARAFVGGALAGLVGHAQIYISGGAEHQGPDGGGPVAVIARREGM